MLRLVPTMYHSVWKGDGIVWILFVNWYFDSAYWFMINLVKTGESVSVFPHAANMLIAASNSHGLQQQQQHLLTIWEIGRTEHPKTYTSPSHTSSACKHMLTYGHAQVTKEWFDYFCFLRALFVLNPVNVLKHGCHVVSSLLQMLGIYCEYIFF